MSMRDSLADREAATNLAPGDAKNWVRLAHFEQQRGLNAGPAYLRAVAASPLSAEAWIGLGLEEELAGDFPAAERHLLHAAEISREYVPRWTLLNYYFRQDDAAHFWPWAKQALILGTGDLQPVFRMAWSLSGDSGQIAREALPARPFVFRQYLSWLTSEGKLDAASEIAPRLLENAQNDDLPSLLYYCDIQLARGQLKPARIVWAGILSRHLLPGLENSPGLTNPRFEQAPLNSGFDWRFPKLDGLTGRSSATGFRINFTGKQPEACEPLSQYITLEPDRQYKLAYEYRTLGIAADSGLFWRVVDARTGRDLSQNSPNLSRDLPGWDSFTFKAPSHVAGGRLVLTYKRTPGTTRITGWLELRQVTLLAVN